MKPHPTFNLFRPDEVAETFDNVSDDLYQALWESMDGMEPVPSTGDNSLASVWDKFTPEQQEELNALVP